tara:strand:- start:3856 stop:3969 length:114 start_codon:yes stop_codon:yes gene_type:complete
MIAVLADIDRKIMESEEEEEDDDDVALFKTESSSPNM